MPHNMIIFFSVYLIFMPQIVFYFVHNTSVLSFYIDAVLTLSKRESIYKMYSETQYRPR